MALYLDEPKPEKHAQEKRQSERSFLEHRLELGLSADRLLDAKVEQACTEDGVDYRALEPIQRLFLTHYRCPICKLLPLYFLDLTYPKRVRCRKCGQLICFRSTGKWGRMRKKVAFQFMLSVRDN